MQAADQLLALRLILSLPINLGAYLLVDTLRDFRPTSPRSFRKPFRDIKLSSASYLLPDHAEQRM